MAAAAAAAAAGGCAGVAGSPARSPAPLESLFLQLLRERYGVASEAAGFSFPVDEEAIPVFTVPQPAAGAAPLRDHEFPRAADFSAQEAGFRARLRAKDDDERPAGPVSGRLSAPFVYGFWRDLRLDGL